MILISFSDAFIRFQLKYFNDTDNDSHFYSYHTHYSLHHVIQAFHWLHFMCDNGTKYRIPLMPSKN